MDDLFAELCWMIVQEESHQNKKVWLVDRIIEILVPKTLRLIRPF